jgi:hypothetical protein
MEGKLPADDYLASGEAWADFCDGLKEVGRDLLRETAPKSAVDMAEGHRYLTRMLRSAFELIMEGANPHAPELFLSLSPTIKIGWDNPDNIHLNARLYPELDYRLWGTRGDAHYLSFAVYGGSYGRDGGRSTVAYVRADDLEIDEDGRFEVFLSQREYPKNWIRLNPDATTLMIRQTFWDKPNQTPANLRIERLDREGLVPPLDPSFVVGALRRTLRYLKGTNKIFFELSDKWAEKPNTWFESDPALGEQTQGIRGMYYGSGWWECQPDEAVVLDWNPPDCRYWSIVLSNYWGESFEYRYRNVQTNQRRATYRTDGSVRFIIAHQDPQIPDANWLDTESHGGGVWTLRVLEAQTNPVPEVRVIPLVELSQL